jgi:hypothetical protein
LEHRLPGLGVSLFTLVPPCECQNNNFKCAAAELSFSFNMSLEAVDTVSLNTLLSAIRGSLCMSSKCKQTLSWEAPDCPVGQEVPKFSTVSITAQSSTSYAQISPAFLKVYFSIIR